MRHLFLLLFPFTLSAQKILQADEMRASNVFRLGGASVSSITSSISSSSTNLQLPTAAAVWEQQGNFGQKMPWITYVNSNSIPPGWSPVFANTAQEGGTPGPSAWHILNVFGGSNSGFKFNIGTSFFGGPIWYKHIISGSPEPWRRLDGNFGVYDIENMSSTFAGNTSLGWNVVGSYTGTPSDGPGGSPQYFHLSLQGGRDQPNSKLWLATARPANAGSDKSYIWINGVDGNGWVKSKAGYADAAGTLTVSGTDGQYLTRSGGVWVAGNAPTSSTNIGLGTRTATTVPLVSSTGTGVDLPVATTGLAGLLSSSDKNRLDGLANFNSQDWTLPSSGTTLTLPNATASLVVANASANSSSSALILRSSSSAGDALGAGWVSFLNGSGSAIGSIRPAFASDLVVRATNQLVLQTSGTGSVTIQTNSGAAGGSFGFLSTGQFSFSGLVSDPAPSNGSIYYNSTVARLKGTFGGAVQTFSTVEGDFIGTTPNLYTGNRTLVSTEFITVMDASSSSVSLSIGSNMLEGRQYRIICRGNTTNTVSLLFDTNMSIYFQGDDRRLPPASSIALGGAGSTGEKAPNRTYVAQRIGTIISIN